MNGESTTCDGGDCTPVLVFLLIGVLAGSHMMDDDDFVCLFEKDAVTSNPQTQQTIELTGERFDITPARLRVAVYRFQNPYGYRLSYSADLGRDTWQEEELFHACLYFPGSRISSILKPHSAANCSNGTPPPGFCRK